MPKHVERRGRPRTWSGPIAEWMIASGIRADRLADQVGVDLSTVFKWCRGEQNPTLDKAQVIVEIARRSGCRRKLTLEDIFKPRDLKPGRGENHDGVFPGSTPEARDRRLATSTE